MSGLAYVGIYHWDRCVEKTLYFEKTWSFRTLELQIRKEFSKEIGVHFRLYSLPANYIDLGDRIPIRTIDEFNTFVERDEINHRSGLDRNQLYILNSFDESPTKLPENTKVIKDNCGEDSSRTNRSKRAAGLCRKRDENKCVFCGHKHSASIQHCHFLGLKEYREIKNESDRQNLLLSLKVGDINDITDMICLWRNCHIQLDNNRIGVHPEEKTLLIVKAVGLKVAQGGNTYSELSKTTNQFNKPQPPLKLLEHRYEFFKEMLLKESNARPATRKKQKSARLKAYNTARPNAKKTVPQNVKKTVRSNAKKTVPKKVEKAARPNAKNAVRENVKRTLRSKAK